MTGCDAFRARGCIEPGEGGPGVGAGALQAPGSRRVVHNVGPARERLATGEGGPHGPAWRVGIPFRNPPTGRGRSAHRVKGGVNHDDV